MLNEKSGTSLLHSWTQDPQTDGISGVSEETERVSWEPNGKSWEPNGNLDRVSWDPNGNSETCLLLLWTHWGQLGHLWAQTWQIWS